VVRCERAGTRRGCNRPAEPMSARLRKTGQWGDHRLWRGVGRHRRGTEIKTVEPLIDRLGDSVPKPLGFSAFAPEWLTSGAVWGGWPPPRHSGTWVGARVASLRCHYPPPRRSQYSRNAKAQPHKSKTSCRGGHRRGTTTSGPGCGPLAGFEVILYGRFWGDRRGWQ
jgi:hypothetical protein